MTRALAAFLLAAVLGRALAAEDATIALNFQDVELPVLAKLVSEVTGRNFILDDRVRGRVTIISPTRITPDEAYLVFQSVLQVKGFTTVPSGAFVKIVPARDATSLPAGPATAEVETRILPLRHADATTVVPALQPLVSKDGLLTAYPPTNSLIVVDAHANVERLAGLLADLDAPASGRAMEVVVLRHAPAGELARRIRDAFPAADAGGLRIVADDRTRALVLSGAPAEVERARTMVARLDTAAPAGSSRVHVVRLRYADAENLARVLGRLVGAPPGPPPESQPHGSSLMRASARRTAMGRGYEGGEPPPPAEPPAVGDADAIALQAPVRVTADRATNALIVNATPEDFATLRAVVDQLDVRRRQVFVEAIILEATVEKTRALGVEFRAAGTIDGGTQGLAQANLSALTGALTDPTSVPGLLLAAASNERVRLPDGSLVPAHSVLLTALQTESDVNVLSAPNIVTTDNEEAEIVVGRNVPFLASRATSGTNLENLFVTVERHDVGITLRMVPQITADDFVRLTLFEEVSDIDPTAPAVGDPAEVGPVTTIRSASTAVAARDGQTVVIGGLLADTVRGSERTVPYLGRIPVLGALFRRDDTRRMKTNLLVFLTPHIIATDRQMADSSTRERARMRAAMPPALRERPALTAPSWDPPPAAGDATP